MSEHTHPDYWKIYKWLLVLFAVSVLGPWLFPDVKVIVLLTAFGIAVVKALLVAANFMHLNVERKYIWHLFLICLVFLFVLFAAVAPDVLNNEGHNWKGDDFTGVSRPESHHESTHAAATTSEKTKPTLEENVNAPKPVPAVEPEPEKVPSKEVALVVPKAQPQKPAPSRETTKKPTQVDPSLIAAGKALFQTKICFTCYQVDPKIPSPAGSALKAPGFIGKFWGTEREVHVGVLGGPIEKITMNEAYFLESVEKPMAKILKGSIPGMAPLPTTLEERKALMAYVRSLSE